MILTLARRARPIAAAALVAAAASCSSRPAPAPTNDADRAEIERLRDSNVWLQRQLDDVRRELDQARTALLLATRGPPEPISRMLPASPVPLIEARVLATQAIDDGAKTLVLLSAGADQHVEKGFHFSVYRGSIFVGKVVVEKVLPTSSGCRILFVKEGEEIRVGDAAATRLE